MVRGLLSLILVLGVAPRVAAVRDAEQDAMAQSTPAPGYASKEVSWGEVQMHIADSEQSAEAEVPTQGDCDRDKANWAVFVESAKLGGGFGSHSELLFCYLEVEDRESLVKDEEMPREDWEKRDTWCSGITFGGTGIELYRKQLKEVRMFGASVQPASIIKVFKGCVKAYPDWTRKPMAAWKTQLDMKLLPSEDDRGFWMCYLEQSILTWQSTWWSTNYDVRLGSIAGNMLTGGVYFKNRAVNCNTFAATVLGCVFGLSHGLSLPSMAKTSMFQFDLNCMATDADAWQPVSRACYVLQPPAIYLQALGAKSFVSGSSNGVSSSSSSKLSSSSSSKSKSGKALQSPQLESCTVAVDVKFHEGACNMYARYQLTGCFCDEKKENCAPKACDVSTGTCGELSEDSYCTWCCKLKDPDEDPTQTMYRWVAWNRERPSRAFQVIGGTLTGPANAAEACERYGDPSFWVWKSESDESMGRQMSKGSATCSAKERLLDS